MSRRADAFAGRVRETLDNFLQTVVMVDDEAYREVPRASVGEDDWAGGDDRPSRPRKLRLPPAAEDLDGKAAVDAFAEKGLVCSILSPQDRRENKSVGDPLVKTARRADLVVLDWRLNDDDGDTTLELLRRILRDDDGGIVERRLRVVAIYTGEKGLDDICSRALEVVADVLPDASVERHATLPQFSCDFVRVVVLAKEHSEIAAHHRAQRVSIAELPDRLTDEFAELSNGLLATAALAALAGLRDDAHRLLTALGPRLDPALLGQRVALDPPSDVERQVEELVAAEIAAIVADQEVGRFAGLSFIKDWLAAQPELPPGGIARDVTASHRWSFLKLGLGSRDRVEEQIVKTGLTSNKLSGIAARGTHLFVTNESDAELSNRAYFERMVFSTRYSQPRAVLRLGTLIAHGDTYALCVQPLCDSARLRKATAFPFLLLNNTGKLRSSHLRIGLHDSHRDDQWIELGIDAAVAQLTFLTFEPNADGVVIGNGGKVVRFKALDRRRRRRPRFRHWRLVANLKPEQAQRAVERLARDFSRVGLTEPEGLRRKKG